MKIAAATYPLDWHESWESYKTKKTRWVRAAADEGAELLVFPEYGSMELASLAGVEIAADLEKSLRVVDALRSKADELYAELSAQYGVFILGASAPSYSDGGRPTNRAVLFSPAGASGYQDKMVPTRYEREKMDISAGRDLRLFETGIGRIGVIICYDAEFPEMARRMVEAGAEILLAPSCTEQMSGYWRVRIGAMARALESQCVVVQSPLCGAAAWNPVVSNNTGAAGIYGPPDIGFPETGVINVGVMNEPTWVYGKVSREAIAHVRADGRVLNKTHWAEQAEWCQRVNTQKI